MKKRNIYIYLFSVVAIVGIIVCITFLNKKEEIRAPKPDQNRYNLHCEKITISVDDKVVVELTGKDKEKMLKYFDNNAITGEYDTELKFDESNNIMVDFNNGITKLYMSKERSYAYFDTEGGDNIAHKLKEEVHEEIIKLIEENQ